jgi:hypothetical protein
VGGRGDRGLALVVGAALSAVDGVPGTPHDANSHLVLSASFEKRVCLRES